MSKTRWRKPDELEDIVPTKERRTMFGTRKAIKTKKFRKKNEFKLNISLYG